MSAPNHYQTLGLSIQATQGQIKAAYRRLAKQFHPDLQTERANHDQIVLINAAYEVLGDPQRRHRYDQQLLNAFAGEGYQTREQRSAQAQTDYQDCRHQTQVAEVYLNQWLEQVYNPINRLLILIVKPLQRQIDHLAADPFDEELMGDFQGYLTTCRRYWQQAQTALASLPNPSKLAGVAANLYYCLEQLGDGLEELEFFTLNYDEYYLHTGQELFRIARSFHREAQKAASSFQKS